VGEAIDQVLVRGSRDKFRIFADYCWRLEPGHIRPWSNRRYQQYVLKRVEEWCAANKVPVQGYLDDLRRRGVVLEKLEFYQNEITQLLGRADRPKRIHIQAPREHAKTTLLSVKYPIWRLGRNPNLRILIVSKTATLAQAIVREIRRNIESNPRIHKVFPNLKPATPWSDTEICVQRDRVMKTSTLRGIGLYGSITGFRADIIILDDPFDQHETRTEGQRLKIEEFIEKVVIPILDPEGEVIYVGTRWHYDDYWGKLLSRSQETGGEVFCKVYQAINYLDPDDPEGGPRYSLWPQKWSLEKLEERRRDIGTPNFNCLYQNDPRGLEGLFFKKEWITWYDPHILKTIPELYIFQGVDPAIGESPESKRTAIATVALDPRDMGIFMLDIYAAQIDFPTQLKKISEYSKRTAWLTIPEKRGLKPLKLGVEANAYQKALSRTAQMAALPVVECKTTEGKPDRMLSLQPHFENGRIRWPDPKKLGYTPRWLEELLNEYLSFPRGKYTDMLDALDFAIEVADKSGSAEVTAFFG